MSPNTGSNATHKKTTTMNRTRRSSDEKAKEMDVTGIVFGKNVLITGGLTGIGYAFFNHFIQLGASKICVVDIDDAAAKKIAGTKGSGEFYYIHADVSRYNEITAAFEEAVKLMDGIDIVVNNAGILDERRWERQIAVNLGGMTSVAMLSMKHMGKDQGGRGGVLVNISQHINIQYTAQLPIYTATKQAIIGLSQSLGAPSNMERTGVRVITLCPGLTETALTIESPNKLLSRVMKADFVKNLEKMSIQTPYVVAQGLASILMTGESGSIWVIENGESPYEVFMPNCRSLRRMYKNNFTVADNVKISSKGRPIREVCDNTRTGLMSCA